MAAKAPTKLKGKVTARSGNGNGAVELSAGFSAVVIEKADLGFTSKDTHELTSVFIASDVKKNIRDAIKFRNTNELIGIIVETKLDFLVAGFRNHYREDSSKKFYDDLVYEHDLDSIVTELADDYLTTGSAILHWKIDDQDGGNIEYIMTLDPGYVEYHTAMGKEKLEIILDPASRSSLRKLTEAQKKDIPEKYLRAGSAGKVELKNEDGEYWMILTDGRKYRGLPNPSMAAIFADLKLREMFVAGDWSLAFFAKAFIQLVKSGESVQSGQFAGTKRLYQTTEENTALNNLLKDVSRALRIVGNHTLEIEQIVPPEEAYSQGKYGAVETRILRWGGVPKVIIEGQGGNYASGFLGKVKMFADIKRKRRRLGKFIERFYRQPTINTKEMTPPLVRFDEQILKDTKEQLNELKLLLQYATGFSARSTLEILGHEPDTEWDLKKAEVKIREVLVPLFEPNQGQASGGRPGDEPSKTPPTDVSQRRDARATSDFSTDSYYHVEVPGVSGEIVATKSLSNGVKLRLARQPNGKTKAKIVLIPKSMVDGLSEAKKYVASHYAEAIALESKDEDAEWGDETDEQE